MGRPIADSPEYVGDLFYIYVPVDSIWVLHKVSTTEEAHDKHISAMVKNGNGSYRTAVETRPSQNQHAL